MTRMRIWITGAVAAAMLAAPAAASAADFAIEEFSVDASTQQGGAHPDVTVTTAFPAFSLLGPAPDRVRDVHLSLPPGLIGNPAATAKCPQATFASGTCPGASRVGTVAVTAKTLLGAPAFAPAGDVFNVQPNADEPARLGFVIPLVDIRVPITVSLRPDGGLDTVMHDLPTSALGIPIYTERVELTLFGKPGATPFMTNPTSCGQHAAALSATSYGGTTDHAAAGFTNVGCNAVPFTPGAAIHTETSKRGAPSGYSVTLTVPADEGPPRQAHLRRAAVTLPEGTTLSPGVAQGLVACTDAQFAAQCPAASQIGTVEFVTPLMAAPLNGKVYFAAPTPARPVGLFVAVDQAGVKLKLTGAVKLDPATGRITTVFDNLPQVPFTSFTLSFQGGAKAVLANPTGCGSQTMTTRLTPWSGNPDATPSASFTTDADGAGGACAAPRFRPALSLAVAARSAGRPAGAVTLRLSRPDGDEAIGRVVTAFPPGLAGAITGVGICPEDRVATGGDCPEASRVGSVTAKVGSGPAPVTLSGRVFLTGPAEGGLVGLAIVIPGKVGPIDLGTVVTRAGIVLRPTDGGLTVRTSDLPRVVGGVPVSIRELALTLDRPGFMRNATSCAPLAVSATFTSQSGTVARASAPYRAEHCDRLAYSPRIAATLGGRGHTKGRQKPELTTVITVPAGHAASRSVAVTLPTNVGVDFSRLAARCTAQQAKARACPAASRIGSVTARTSLLPVRLTGSVYLSDIAGAPLPGLLVSFTSPVALDLAGSVDLRPEGVKSTFGGVPDVPLERFELALDGGRSGALALATGVDLCKGKAPKIRVDFVSHSGATASERRRVKVAGCGPRAKLQLHRLRTRRPTLELTVRKRSAGKALKRVRLRLPGSLHVHRARVERGLRAAAGGKPVKATLSRKGVLAVRAARGAGKVVVKVGKGAFTASRRLRGRLSKHPRLTFRLRVTDTAKHNSSSPLKTRVGRRR